MCFTAAVVVLLWRAFAEAMVSLASWLRRWLFSDRRSAGVILHVRAIMVCARASVRGAGAKASQIKVPLKRLSRCGMEIALLMAPRPRRCTQSGHNAGAKALGPLAQARCLCAASCARGHTMLAHT